MWRILLVLQSINASKVVLGESAVTAAPFFESVGRPSKSLGVPQPGNKLILWESLSAVEGGVPESATERNMMGYMVQGQSTHQGQRGTGIPGAQQPHLYG
jgi:hypothetical protein